MNDLLKQYYELQTFGEQEYQRLAQYFSSQIRCKAGCPDCCVEIAVFPVEWMAIELWLKDNHPEKLNNRKNQCIFLVNGSCSIYPVRPLICRVNGVPLLNRSEQDEGPEWEVTWCEYNFTNTDTAGDEEIGPETMINMEELNIQLAEINYLFLKTREGAPFNLKKRYTMNGLYRTRDFPGKREIGAEK